MRFTQSLIGLAVIKMMHVSAKASLADVCTTAYVQSALPADGFIEGITLSSASVTSNPVTNYTVPLADLNPSKAGLDFCNVTFSYSHTGLDDTTNLWFWLPSPEQYKNRYVSTGGGGLRITSGEMGLGVGIVYGAVTGTTDGGFGGWDAQVSDVILAANGTLNYTMLNAFGYNAIHEMTVLGKELSRKFYNSSDLYSYWQGCSEGGREGWSQVQRYGAQFDGAAIGAPAFRQAFQQVNHLFSGIVELTHDYFPSPCELERINNDTIAACDALDGKVDGVVSRTDLCKLHYDPKNSIGKSYSCPATGPGTVATKGTVTAKAAAVARDIWKGLYDSKGRQVYVSYQPSADFDDAQTTYNSATGKYEYTASGISIPYVNQFLKQIDSNTLSLTNVTYDTLREWILEGMQKFSGNLQTTWPDLEDFHNNGGKVIHFHGESDPSIPPISSVIYHDAVRQIMYPNKSFDEGYDSLHDWYKLFLVPGAAHCSRNPEQPNGPFPTNVLQSVIDWVENGIDPKELNATVSVGTSNEVDQKICSFPLRPLWKNNHTMECVYDKKSINTWLPKLDSIPVPVY